MQHKFWSPRVVLDVILQHTFSSPYAVLDATCMKFYKYKLLTGYAFLEYPTMIPNIYLFYMHFYWMQKLVPFYLPISCLCKVSFICQLYPLDMANARMGKYPMWYTVSLKITQNLDNVELVELKFWQPLDVFVCRINTNYLLKMFQMQGWIS